MDLTLVAVMIGMMTCPSPNGEGLGFPSLRGDESHAYIVVILG